MRFLVTNDDGINAIGIRLLVEKLKKYTNDILVVAPSVEMSATSHKLTLRSGIEFEQVEDIVPGVLSYKAMATPADCVKLAACYLKYSPDIVFSGINNGYNCGDDIMYSGTVAAASEAAFLGYKAFSISCKAGTTEGTERLCDILDEIFNNDIYQEAKIINVNIPPKPKGIKLTHQGRYIFSNKYIKNPKDGLLYIEAKPDLEKNNNLATSDVEVINSGYVSICPLTYDRTDILLYNKLKDKE